MAGRAGQLPDRRGVGGRGGSIFQCLAARRPSDRQGHPGLPRGVLARISHGGRHRAAPQEDPVPLPLDGRGREDVQVERSDRFFGLILYYPPSMF